MDNSEITIDTLIEDLLKTDILKKVMCRNGQEFVYMLADWLVRYILVLCSKYEVGDEDFQDILYYFHGENLWEIMELSQYFMSEPAERIATSMMNAKK